MTAKEYMCFPLNENLSRAMYQLILTLRRTPVTNQIPRKLVKDSPVMGKYNLKLLLYVSHGEN